MTKYDHILDNRTRKVVDYLRQHLSAAEVFRLVSAYFTIYGYEALQSGLRGVKDVRFLFGDPASVGQLDPGEKAQKAFNLTETGYRLSTPCNRNTSPNRYILYTTLCHKYYESGLLCVWYWVKFNFFDAVAL